MNGKTVFPCPEWTERLAAMHPADLSQSDYVALQQHVRGCSACAIVYAQYRALGSLIRALPASDLSSAIPPRIGSLPNRRSLLNEATEPAPGNEASHRRSSRPFLFSFLTKRRVWLSLLAAVLLLGLLGGVFLLHPFASTPASPQNGSGATASAATQIAPLPILNQSTLYMSNGVVHAFQSDTGALTRDYSVANAPLRTPAIVNGGIYIGTYSDMYALRLTDGALLWHDPVGNGTLLPPTVVDGIVYVLPNVLPSDTALDALRASDGKLLWQYAASRVGAEVTLPVVVHGIAYIGASTPTSADVEALDTANGALLWRHRVGTTYVALSVENDVIYAGTRTTLTALHTADGSVLWQQSLGTRLIWLTAADGVVYAITDDGYLSAKRESDGSTLWRYKTGEEATSVASPVVVGGMVYIAILSSSRATGNNGYVYALRASDGHLIWQYELGSNVIPALTVGQGKVYAMSRDGWLYALQASTGSVVWKAKAPVLGPK